jgi:hypothetical protein
MIRLLEEFERKLPGIARMLILVIKVQNVYVKDGKL